MSVSRASSYVCAVSLIGTVVLGAAVACRDFGGETTTPPGGRNGSSGSGGESDLGDYDEPDSGGRGGEREAGNGGAHDVGGAPSAEPPVGGNAAGDAGAGGAPSQIIQTLEPTDFPSLALWLEASSDTYSVDTLLSTALWKDRSSFATPAIAVEGYEPPALRPNVVNGHAALHFVPTSFPDRDNPSSLQVLDAPSLRFGNDDFAYVVVASWINAPKPRLAGDPRFGIPYVGSGTILSKSSDQFPYWGIAIMGNFPSSWTVTDATTRFAVQLATGGPLAISYSDGLNDGAARVYTMRRRSTDLTLRINAVPEGASRLSASVNVDGPGGPLLIGGIPGQPLSGDIAEIVALHGEFTDDELASLERHLLQKYALH